LIIPERSHLLQVHLFLDGKIAATGCGGPLQPIKKALRSFSSYAGHALHNFMQSNCKTKSESMVVPTI